MAASKQMTHLDRVKKLSHAIGIAISQANDEQTMLDTICRLIVEEGGYCMAWVGFPSPLKDQDVVVASHFGIDDGYLKEIRISWKNTESGRGITGTAIRTSVTQVNQDFLNNPNMLPWRDAALKRGYQSSIAIPLDKADGVFGALMIYAREPQAFEAEEVEILEFVVRNISKAIARFRAHIATPQ
jgi:GAF domain-containing protein